MPFYTPLKDSKCNIDYDKYKPIYVHFYTDTDSNIKPLKIKYEDENGFRTTVNIDSVKYTKDVLGGYLYRCLVINNGRQQEIDIVFFTMEHTWYLLIN